MEFGILGPLEVRDGDRVIALGGPKPRALFALLLLNANETVSAERLAMGLWGEDAAQDAVKTLQIHVSRLRKALGRSETLETTGGGYRLRVGSGELDADRFQRLVADASERLAAGESEPAATALREALALWRGPALADVAAAPFAAAAAARFDEQRLAALELRVEADLARGRHAELVGELQQLTAAHPVRERFHGQLMLALYRCGRQADALDAYRRAHAHLADELGLEPGPPLRTLQADILAQSSSLDPPPARAPATGLPARAGALLGRDADVEAVIGLLGRNGPQLVTVIGVGGVGKTSLAIEVAHRLAGAATFVDLAPVSDPAGVLEATLRAVGAAVEPGDTPTAALRRVLAARPRLLVLDNFEHLTDAASLLTPLLEGAPGLKLLVTSRAALDLRSEQRYALEPLALPESSELDDVETAPASALFLARAMARDAALRLTSEGAAAIASVCRRLDALPLAIELAAARTSVLSPQEIARRLDSVLGGLGTGPRDAPARQQTLRATLDWSYALLDDEERTTFARLAVFAGGCDADAAERVAGASLDLVERLVAKSMLTRRAGVDGATRLVMLEAVREYAAERLAERPDAAEAEERHGRHYLELAEAAHPGLMGPDQVAWTRRIDAEAANVLRALERARDIGDAALVLRVITALDEWWFARGLWSEGRAWCRWGLDHSDESVPPEIRAAAWQCLGYLLWPENEPDRVLEAADRAWELASTAGDVTSMAWSMILRAHALAVKPDGPAAVAAAEEAVRLARDVDDQALGVAYEALAISTRDRDERRRTARLAAEHLERAGDLRALGRMCEELSYAALVDGQVHEAAELIERAMVLKEQLDDPAELVWTLVTGGLVALERGDDAAAQRHLVDALDQYLSRGIRAMLPEALLALAVLAARDGDPVRAGRLVGAAHGAGTFDELDRRLEATAREAAGAPPGEWEQAVGAGQALSWDKGIALALEAG